MYVCCLGERRLLLLLQPIVYVSLFLFLAAAAAAAEQARAIFRFRRGRVAAVNHACRRCLLTAAAAAAAGLIARPPLPITPVPLHIQARPQSITTAPYDTKTCQHYATLLLNGLWNCREAGWLAVKQLARLIFMCLLLPAIANVTTAN